MSRRLDLLANLAKQWREQADACMDAAEERELRDIDSEYLHAVEDMSRQHASELEAVLAGATSLEGL